MSPSLVGMQFRAMRVAAGLYQQDIAARIKTADGRHRRNQGTVSKWECGIQSMSDLDRDLYLQALTNDDSQETVN